MRKIILFVAALVVSSLAVVQGQEYMVVNKSYHEQKMIDKFVNDNVVEGVRHFAFSFEDGELHITPDYDNESNVVHSEAKEIVQLRTIIEEWARLLIGQTKSYPQKMPDRIVLTKKLLTIYSLDSTIIRQYAVKSVKTKNDITTIKLNESDPLQLIYREDDQDYVLEIDDVLYELEKSE